MKPYGVDKSVKNPNFGAGNRFWLSELFREQGITVSGNTQILRHLSIPLSSKQLITQSLQGVSSLRISFQLRYDQLQEIAADPADFAGLIWSNGKKSVALLAPHEIANQTAELIDRSTVEGITTLINCRQAIAPERLSSIIRDKITMIAGIFDEPDGELVDLFDRLLETLNEVGSRDLNYVFLRELSRNEERLWAITAYEYFTRLSPRDYAEAYADLLMEFSAAKHPRYPGYSAYDLAIANYRLAAKTNDKPAPSQKKFKKAENLYREDQKRKADEFKWDVARLFREAAREPNAARKLVDIVVYRTDEFDAIVGRNPLKAAVDLEDAITSLEKLETAAREMGRENTAEYFWGLTNRLISDLFESAYSKKEVPATSIRVADRLLDQEVIYSIEDEVAARIEANVNSINPNQRQLCRVIMWRIYYDQAKKAFEADELDLAIDRLLAAKRMIPDNRKPDFVLAGIHCDKAAKLLDEGNEPAVLAELAKGMAFSVKGLTIWLQYGVHFLYEGRYDQALRYAETIKKVKVPVALSQSVIARWLCSINSFHGFACLEKYLETGVAEYLENAEKFTAAALAYDRTEPTTPLIMARIKAWRGDHSRLLPAIEHYMNNSTHPETKVLEMVMRDVLAKLKKEGESPELMSALCRLSQLIADRGQAS